MTYAPVPCLPVASSLIYAARPALLHTGFSPASTAVQGVDGGRSLQMHVLGLSRAMRGMPSRVAMGLCGSSTDPEHECFAGLAFFCWQQGRWRFL